MKTLSRKTELIDALSAFRSGSKSIGFVPTMGALHAGHLDLVKRSIAGNDITVVSIFVNPTQFNNAGDLDKYPRTLDKDSKLLADAGTGILFLPSVEEMYPHGTASEHFDLGNLEAVMEGAFRPGHFQGVVTIVKRLLEAVKPHRAYFGEKDFQQLAVIRHMVRSINLPVEIIGCPTVREDSGLAMSSRNTRLSEEQRRQASTISKALFRLRDEGRKLSLEEAKKSAIEYIETGSSLKVEYLEIAHEDSLQPVKQWSDDPLRAFAAVFAGEVRLIDNVGL